MKNILFITTMYPTQGGEFHLNTPVCHYFTKEWCKKEYNVKVIHYQSIFPIFFYWALSLFPKLAARFIGNDKNDTNRRIKDIHFIIDNVPVVSIPIFKLIPHGKYMKITISKQINKILKLNELDDFIPDAIIGHFHNPQIEIISKLKDIYPNAQTCIVLHENASVIKKTYSKHWYSYMSNIDLWGFRSDILKKEFENIYGRNKNTFICYSGVPEQFASKSVFRDFSKKISKFVYVGQLIERKYPSALITAIYNVYPEKQYQISYVGKGYKEDEILTKARLLDVSDNIKLLGEISRDQIMHVLDESDLFIMIPRDEVFGLVYLEAMARGCITIGSKNEGIDGIIQDGINGFLCEAGNTDELEEILKQINALSSEELIKISQNAIETAKGMTDSIVAEKYINVVFNH